MAPHPLERAPGRAPALARLAAGLAAAGLTALALSAAADPPSWAGATMSSGTEVLVAPLTGAAVACLLVAIFPRAGWLLAAAGCIAALAEPWPEAAALTAAAIVAVPLLLRRHGLAWSVPAAAPALGLATFAGAYPAVAGLARNAYTRAGLGAAGLWWLLLAEPLLDENLAFGTPSGSAADVLEAIATGGGLLLAPLWAFAALVLPWLVPGRSLAADVAGATAWAAGLAAGTAAIATYAGLAEPRGLAAGAIGGAALAVIGIRAGNTLSPDDDCP